MLNEDAERCRCYPASQPASHLRDEPGHLEGRNGGYGWSLHPYSPYSFRSRPFLPTCHRVKCRNLTQSPIGVLFLPRGFHRFPYCRFWYAFAPGVCLCWRGRVKPQLLFCIPASAASARCLFPAAPAARSPPCPSAASPRTSVSVGLNDICMRLLHCLHAFCHLDAPVHSSYVQQPWFGGIKLKSIR